MSVLRLKTISATLGAATIAASLLMTGTASAESSDVGSTFSFRPVSYSLNGNADPRFTQLLGVNDKGTIAGYHGDENTENTPNKGFTLKVSSKSNLKFTDENFPGSDQTQVVGIDNSGDTVGFYITQNVTHGFLKDKGKDAVSVDLPGTTFNQLLGINNKGQAAGYFQDNASTPLQHAYIREKNGDFLVLNLPMPSSQATSINDDGTVVGFLQQSTADTKSSGFILKGGKVTELNYPGASFTQALGVNNSDDVVGTYNDNAGTAHGFLYEKGQYQNIDFSDGGTIITGTVVNGINNHDEIVGFYTKSVPVLGSTTTQTDTVGFIGKPNKY